ncbi:Tat pathway signal sequence domain protein [Rothia aeria F0184]|uniref:Tat pathway signal sequence domain protein n=1 Tax=Rothia aeria F0184 TaxID=888019 RepID=U7V3X6_9MICC|nr:Tat pathway signal sequence domain protein [Rothia aeria F0184]
MTRGISRRKLVAGAAWAAPAVLTSTVVSASVTIAPLAMTSRPHCEASSALTWRCSALFLGDHCAR